MPNLTSPGVSTTETTLQTTPVVSSTTVGALAGVFRWGPVYTPVLVDSEPTLVGTFGTPSGNNFETWFTAANFLGYSDGMYVVRTANTTGFANALAATWTNTTVAVLANTAVANVSNSGISANMVVVGPGIPVGTLVVSAVGTTNTSTTVTISKPTTNSSAATVSFLSPNGAFTAVANSSSVTDPWSRYNVSNSSSYDLLSPSFGSYANFIAKYPGVLGNSLQVSVCDSANQYSSNINITANLSVNSSTSNITFVVGSNVATVTVANTGSGNDIQMQTLANNMANQLVVGDVLVGGNSATIGAQYLQITSIGTVVVGNTTGTNTGTSTFTVQFASPFALSTNSSLTTIQRYWQFYKNVDGAPGQSSYVVNYGNTSANDELHVVVADVGGLFSNVPGSILEVYKNVSRATDAKSDDGTSNYYKTVINLGSNYVWYGADRTGAASNTAANVASSTNGNPLTLAFVGGQNGDSEANVPFAVVAKGYDYFKSAADLTVSLIMTGKNQGGVVGEQVINYVYDNIIASRKDCVGFASPPANTVVISSNSVVGQEAQNIVTWGNSVRATDYVVLDSGYKYQYDKYNGVYRWIPLNADIAGTCAYTDAVRDPWYSPGGFSRGQIQNVVKLAFNPRKTDRDVLYQNFINPVVTFPGKGTVLFGDKTHLGRQTVFSRINVRRLFNVLKKAIATAAESQLFEFNDQFSQAQFVSAVTPFLRDVQSRRGIVQFKVVCDGTNNTAQVVNANEFVGDIYIQPNQSINFIVLNFYATPAGFTFSEAVTQV